MARTTLVFQRNHQYRLGETSGAGFPAHCVLSQFCNIAAMNGVDTGRVESARNALTRSLH